MNETIAIVPVHEFSARIALHGEGDHHPDADLLLRIALHPGHLLGVEVRGEVLVQHLAFTHGGRLVGSTRPTPEKEKR